MHGGTQGADHNLKLSVRECLGFEGKRQYFAPIELITYLRSLREIEIDQLEEGLKYMNEGIRLTGTISKRKDKGNRYYGYLNFVKAKATVGIKIIMEAGMERFIAEYIAGNFIPDFTLEELADAALNN